MFVYWNSHKRAFGRRGVANSHRLHYNTKQWPSANKAGIVVGNF